MWQQQQHLEFEQRLVEALDRFHEGKETDDDLHLINYSTGLINYTPRIKHSERIRRIS